MAGEIDKTAAPVSPEKPLAKQEGGTGSGDHTSNLQHEANPGPPVKVESAGPGAKDAPAPTKEGSPPATDVIPPVKDTTSPTKDGEVVKLNYAGEPGAEVHETTLANGKQVIDNATLPDGRSMERVGETKDGTGKWVTKNADGRPDINWVGDIKINSADGPAKLSFVYQFNKAPLSTETRISDGNGNTLVMPDGTLPRQLYDGSAKSLTANALKPLDSLNLNPNDTNQIKIGDAYSTGTQAVAQYDVTLTPAQMAAALKANPDMHLVPDDKVVPPSKYVRPDAFPENPKGQYAFDTPQVDQTTTMNYVWRGDDGELYTMMAQRKGEPFKGQYGAPGGFRGVGDGKVESPIETGVREANEEHGLAINPSDVKLVEAKRVESDQRGHVEDFYGIAEVTQAEVQPLLSGDMNGKDDAGKMKAMKVSDVLKDAPNIAFDHADRLLDGIKEYYPNDYKAYVSEGVIKDDGTDTEAKSDKADPNAGEDKPPVDAKRLDAQGAKPPTADSEVWTPGQSGDSAADAGFKSSDVPGASSGELGVNELTASLIASGLDPAAVNSAVDVLSPDAKNALDRMSPEDREITLKRIQDQLTSDFNSETRKVGGDGAGKAVLIGTILGTAVAAAIGMHEYFNPPSEEAPVTTYDR